MLATSDLHMQITAFDYVRDTKDSGGSLAKLATLIASARAKAEASGAICLLVDNGDTLQGTPIADLLDDENGMTACEHPMATAMNWMNYDAIGLGNHDFDHGLDGLAKALAQFEMPVVCGNLDADTLPMVRKSLMLTKLVENANGTTQELRIGIVSCMPDKAALWSRHHVENRARIEAPLPILKRSAAELKSQGADIVICLAHMGLAIFEEGPDAQNQIARVAQIEEIDVIIGGHTHLKFPGPEHAGLADVDIENGHVHGKPLVQPGASGSDVGEIELALRRSAGIGKWRVEKSTSRLVSATHDTPENAKIVALASEMHKRARAHLAKPVATIDRPMHSYFALAHPSPVPALLAEAKHQSVATALSNTQEADLPLLSVASAALTGGFDGPENFVFLEKGEIKRRHIAGMNPYANHIWAVRTTGHQLKDWLERSALIFNTLSSDDEDQLLINPSVPGFRFDAIYGLTYSIDPSQLPRFDTAGRTLHDRPGRIADLKWQGRPVTDDQAFVVATTDHRAGGGGVFQPFPNQSLVVRGHAPLQEAVLKFLNNKGQQQATITEPWHFKAGLNRSAVLLTSPSADRFLHEIAHLRPETCGIDHDGFLRVRLHL
ncbi:MAG: 5'-nucleotidase C-terminal domain-containing protein [Pseudomonadota bacterium]